MNLNRLHNAQIDFMTVCACLRSVHALAYRSYSVYNYALIKFNSVSKLCKVAEKFHNNICHKSIKCIWAMCVLRAQYYYCPTKCKQIMFQQVMHMK